MFPPSVVCTSVYLPRCRLGARLFISFLVMLFFVFFVGLCLVVPLALFVGCFPFFCLLSVTWPRAALLGIPWALGKLNADDYNS